MRAQRVWIQRGHCFRRTGSTGTAGSGTTEQAYVDDIGRRAAVIMRDEGHAPTVALADTRVEAGYDIFAALHCDGSTSKTASGASIGGRDATDLEVGRVWKARYTARGWPYGFRGDNYTDALRYYYGTGWAAAAGIRYAFVLEHGFLTNPTRDGRFLTTDKGRTIAALALADTVNLMAGGRPVGGGSTIGDDDMDALQRGMNVRGHIDVAPWVVDDIQEVQQACNILAELRVEAGYDDAVPDWHPIATDGAYWDETQTAVGWAKANLPGRGGKYHGWAGRASYGFVSALQAVIRNWERHTSQHQRITRLEKLHQPSADHMTTGGGNGGAGPPILVPHRHELAGNVAIGPAVPEPD